MRGCGIARGLVLASAALGVTAARGARAADIEVQGQTAAQAYEVTGPWGGPGLERRRLLQTLGVSAYHLQGDHVPGAADWQVRLLLRLDADFGFSGHLADVAPGAETDPSLAGGAYHAVGVDPARVDVVYGYLEGRDLGGGWLGVKLGRQPIVDVLGWWSFDGVLARVTTPFFVSLEAYGGFEQRGGLPLSTSRYEMQGVWRGSHDALDRGAGTLAETDVPSFHEAALAPAFGAALEATGPAWLHARLTYRRVYDTGEAITSQFARPAGGYATVSGTRLSSERVGAAAGATLPSTGGVQGGFAYDLHGDVVSHAFGGAEAYATDRLTVGADVDHVEPIFDGDSIWNWFSKKPSTTLTTRASVTLTDTIAVAGWGGARLWRTEGDPDAFGRDQCAAAGFGEDCIEEGTSVDTVRAGVAGLRDDDEARDVRITADGLGSLTGRYRGGQGTFEARTMVQAGARGRRLGGELAGERPLDDGRFSLGARIAVFDWSDPARADRDATSATYVLAWAFRPLEEARLRLEWEQSFDELVKSRVHLLGMLDVMVIR
jgi:hypothetical protein